MTRTIELCENDGCCARVEIEEDEVRIGEEGNLVHLKIEEWRILREKILKGDL